ncbi:hypothetical protein ZIOFF_021485 [Zingiber officinale]|uniref:Uncharacterized protein n=1 Tax=Zingiber officinale TaxID=94328 RepID=A0A8J5H1I7_ZINOF|nr:hypothetical protein ZIOFF_021485 [Zingiber officinale]
MAARQAKGDGRAVASEGGLWATKRLVAVGKGRREASSGRMFASRQQKTKQKVGRGRTDARQMADLQEHCTADVRVRCFASDRRGCRDALAHGVARAAMEAAAVGLVIVTKKSLSNPYSVEMRWFLECKRFIPIFFELMQQYCFARDIIERRGEVWEKHGGQLWTPYGGGEEEWRAVVNGISRSPVKPEVNSGNFRNIIFDIVSLLGVTLGRRSIVEKVQRWREMAGKNLSFPRNPNFVGRKAELTKLKMILFGDIESNLEQCMASKSSNRIVKGSKGIGKTELLLEFAYKVSQSYKMMLWVGGESKYLRQNYLNLLPLLGVDVVMGMETCSQRNGPRSFKEMEEDAIAKVQKELMRGIPFLLLIDNLENEKDWWDGRNIIKFLPHFGSNTHILISSCLPQVFNLKPLNLSYLFSAEAMMLMKGKNTKLTIEDVNALRIIEENLGEGDQLDKVQAGVEWEIERTTRGDVRKMEELAEMALSQQGAGWRPSGRPSPMSIGSGCMRIRGAQGRSQWLRRSWCGA